MCLSCSDIRCGWGLRLSVVPRTLEHMFDKFSRALALMGEAFEDAQAGVGSLPCVDLAAEVDGAQQVINAAWRKVETAAALASRLPLTLAAMSAGDLDWWRASIIATELGEASGESCVAVEALIFPAVLSETAGAVTRRVRRVLARIDADAVRVKAAKERLERFVQAYPSRVPGLTTWVASLPAADSAACWAAIDGLAHRMRGDDPTRTLEQCRADALVDLMLTRSTNASARHCS